MAPDYIVAGDRPLRSLCVSALRKTHCVRRRSRTSDINRLPHPAQRRAVCVCVCVCSDDKARKRERIYIYIYIYRSPRALAESLSNAETRAEIISATARYLIGKFFDVNVCIYRERAYHGSRYHGALHALPFRPADNQFVHRAGQSTFCPPACISLFINTRDGESAARLMGKTKGNVPFPQP